MGDEHIWGMVAFLQPLPQLDADSYRQLVASSDGRWKWLKTKGMGMQRDIPISGSGTPGSQTSSLLRGRTAPAVSPESSLSNSGVKRHACLSTASVADERLNATRRDATRRDANRLGRRAGPGVREVTGLLGADAFRE